MAEEALKVEVGGGRTVSAIRTRAETARPEGNRGTNGDWTFVYAPGAGSNLRDPFGAFLAEQLTSAGISVVRFQFPYSEAGRSAPDRPDVLEATWRAVVEAVRPAPGRLSIGGRSMGGRIASQVVASGLSVAQLTLFAYPLHPPGRPDQARVEHLPRIGVPALFCSGTRDNFGSIEEIKAAALKVPRSEVHVLEGADHGFNVLRSSGRTRADVWAEAAETLRDSLAKMGADAG